METSSIKVPQLPLYCRNPTSPKSRNQTFSFVNGYAVDNANKASKIIKAGLQRTISSSPAEISTIQDNDSSKSKIKIDGTVPSPPSWLLHDRNVLLFNAYFKEPVHESSLENFRVRKCNIYYYLVDGSIHVSEPKIENSGIPQGIFFKRHKIPKNKSGKFYAVADLIVGDCITFYGRSFHIIGCNDTTLQYLKEHDMAPDEELLKNLSFPEDEYTNLRANIMQQETGADSSIYRGVRMNDTKAFVEASLGKHMRNSDELLKFLADDRKVLRFTGYWDDHHKLYASRFNYTIHYFLATDKIEVLEIPSRNDGRDKWPCLLSKQILFKPTDTTTTSLREKYTWNDLNIGGTIDIYGREVVLINCDKYTRGFYESQGIHLAAPIEVMEAKREVIATVPPPHNGIGSEEDSLGSCMSLHPKPPRKDIKKLIDFDNKVLRFAASFSNPRSEDKNRKFYISYYLADDTIGISEPPQRNSGIMGGKFLRRSKYMKEDGKPFHFNDLVVGEEIKLLCNRFLITEADTFTLKWFSNDSNNTDQ